MADQMARLGVVLIIAALLVPARLGDTVGDAMLVVLFGYGAFVAAADQFWRDEADADAEQSP
jgi:hypothetical protein